MKNKSAKKKIVKKVNKKLAKKKAVKKAAKKENKKVNNKLSNKLTKKDIKKTVNKTSKKSSDKKLGVKKSKSSQIKKVKVDKLKKVKVVKLVKKDVVLDKNTVNLSQAKKNKALSTEKLKPIEKIIDNVEEKLVAAVGPERRPLTETEKRIKALMIKKNKKDDNAPRIKLRIDSRTIITVKSKEALKMWKDKYPAAVEVD